MTVNPGQEAVDTGVRGGVAATPEPMLAGDGCVPAASAALAGEVDRVERRRTEVLQRVVLRPDRRAAAAGLLAGHQIDAGDVAHRLHDAVDVAHVRPATLTDRSRRQRGLDEGEVGVGREGARQQILGVVRVDLGREAVDRRAADALRRDHELHEAAIAVVDVEAVVVGAGDRDIFDVDGR
ncbi:hypothetical protein WR25_20506 [Diploscapter pachys]|uniref:Uncharacterized protein n=1 Tax=Diploscapter pachys TaxID=2018661 RepID=A0A2A2M4M0_9BILA|nr:hypothetical protein WR25_20506 [Diploscapter pachys]